MSSAISRLGHGRVEKRALRSTTARRERVPLLHLPQNLPPRFVLPRPNARINFVHQGNSLQEANIS